MNQELRPTVTESSSPTDSTRPFVLQGDEVVIGLAGQPNVGKSTIFNLLTGLSQHVGNWPGKTVERKEGVLSRNGLNLRIVDLPGTYSLTANSIEERVTRDFILNEQPDVVIMVADASALERNLYLLSELLVLPSPVVLALNMMDVAEQQGLHVEAILDIAGGRYEWIGRMVRAAIKRPPMGQISLTDRLDRVAVHPLGGLLLLLTMFGAVFWVTFSVAAPIQNWLDAAVIGSLSEWLKATLVGTPEWLVSLLADGVVGGVGVVITFLPILLIFFTALGFLEDSGYLARTAYIMDRFMHYMGLHGKSFCHYSWALAATCRP